MANTIKHKLNVAIPDGPPSGGVGSTAWNDEHALAGGATGSILLRNTTTSDGGMWLGAVASGSLLTSQGVGVIPAWSSTLSLAGSLTVGTGINITAGDLTLKSNSAAIRQRNFANSSDLNVFSLSGTSTDDLLIGNGVPGLAAVTCAGGLKVQPTTVAAGLFLIRHGSLAVSSYLTSLLTTDLLIGTNNTDAIKITGTEQAVFHLGGANDSVTLPGLGLENRRILSWKGVSGAYGDSGFLWYNGGNHLVFGTNNVSQMALTVNGCLQMFGTYSSGFDFVGGISQGNNTLHAWKDAAGGSTNLGFIRLNASNNLELGTGNVGNRLCITPTGALGLSLIPSGGLDTLGYLVLKNETQICWLDAAAGATNLMYIRATSNNDLRLGAGNSTRMIIDGASGGVMVGSTDATNLAQGHLRLGLALSLVDGVTAPATTTGFAVIYVDTADGDLKIKFGDGTVKTIVVDT